MAADLIEFAISLLAAWLVWRFIARSIRRSDLADTASEPGDPAGQPALLRPRPRPGAGAVAVAEPEDEDPALDDYEPVAKFSPKDRGSGSARVA